MKPINSSCMFGNIYQRQGVLQLHWLPLVHRQLVLAPHHPVVSPRSFPASSLPLPPPIPSRHPILNPSCICPISLGIPVPIRCAPIPRHDYRRVGRRSCSRIQMLPILSSRRERKEEVKVESAPCRVGCTQRVEWVDKKYMVHLWQQPRQLRAVVSARHPVPLPIVATMSRHDGLEGSPRGIPCSDHMHTTMNGQTMS